MLSIAKPVLSNRFFSVYNTSRIRFWITTSDEVFIPFPSFKLFLHQLDILTDPGKWLIDCAQHGL